MNFSFFVGLFLYFSLFFTAVAQSYDFAKIPKAIRLIEKNHIAPIVIGATESNDILRLWMQLLDEDRTLFTQKDMASFALDLSILQDKDKLKSVCNKLLKLYKSSLKSKDSLVEAALKLPFNFQQDQIIFENTDAFCATKKDKENRILASLKLKFYELALSDSIAMSKIEFKNTCFKDEEKYKKIILNDYLEEKAYREITDADIDDHLATALLSAICTRYDPHTEYFNTSEKVKFEKQLSKEVLMFGFTLGEDESNKLSIVALMAGGSAWKTNEINIGDQITKIEFITSKKEVLIKNQNAIAVNQLFDKYNDQEIYLTVKKQDGSIKRIYLAMQTEEVESNVVNSYILEGTSKVAYIALPAFYTDFDPNNSNGSANDIAKEVVKLKKEKIQGLILDLRNNGGGSIEEATSIAGIFVNEGPLAQIKYKSDKPQLLKDLNRGFIYDGPLLVLVNHFSASASELLSMILQDYNRAIIVGSPTFGKASGQAMLPVIENFDLMQVKDIKNLTAEDYVKTTILKIYNVEGQTYQGAGVQPDVFLPDLFQSLNFGESHEPFYLKPDAITKKVVINPFPNNTRTAISKNKYAGNDFFKSIVAYADTMSKMVSKTIGTSLKLDAYYDVALQRQKFYDRMQHLLNLDSQNSFKVDINGIDKLIFTSSEDVRMINNRILDLKSDRYLLEAYRVMEDMIKVK